MVLRRTISAGCFRFQFYSDSIVRIEHSPGRLFRDDATAVICNRSPESAEVSEIRDGNMLVLSTPCLTIRCNPDSSHFTADDLIIKWRVRGTLRQWRFGDADDANLGGTLRSLDCVGAGKLPETQPGVLSRNMYFVLDDSSTPTIDSATGGLIEQHDRNYRDLYFTAYESYSEALRSLALLAGKIPMIPRYSLGLWFSRYFPYSDNDFREIADRFDDLGIPLDVMVFDVDWHRHGWEGYDWNTDLIPDPESLISWLHEKGMKVSANVHPGGVPDQDTHAPQIRNALGLPADKPIRLNLADKNQAEAYMNLLHRSIFDQGVDFWWIDGDAARMNGLDSQHWTNAVYYEFEKRYSDARPMILSRFGGIGSHRYPVGFSGDTRSDWSALKYEVEFTSKSGNALMPYWSHDIGGFSGNHLDSELYIRWLQFGALSPFLRVHSDHGDRAPWEYGDKVSAAFMAIYDLRKGLIPYLYSLCYEASIKSLPLLRPIYLQWPDDEESYSHSGQYMLGDALMVCPVTNPASRGHAHLDIYLPEGTWYDYWTLRRYKGGQVITYSCPINRIPLFARAGAIIPSMALSEKTVNPCPDPLTIHIFYGEGGEFTLYEDDGSTQANERGEYALTRFTAKHENNLVRFIISPAEGTFYGMRSTRETVLCLHGVSQPAAVILDGKEVYFQYDEQSARATMSFTLDCSRGAEITFTNTAFADQVACMPALEVSAALLASEHENPPVLVVSALCEDAGNYDGLTFTVNAPQDWKLTPRHDSRPNYRTFDLGIPRRQMTGHHTIEVKASIDRMRAEAGIDWAYSSVTDFIVIGTFDNTDNHGMDVCYGPETDFGFHQSQDGRNWVHLSEEAIVGDIMPLRYIDLTRHFGPVNDVVAYAITYIHSESPRDVRLDLGSDDGIIAWLNGKEILHAPEPGPAAPGQFRIPVKLCAGWNQVMLKIGQIFGDWGFYFEIKKEDGEPAQGLRISSTI